MPLRAGDMKKGKPCGAGFIAEGLKCGKSTTSRLPITPAVSIKRENMAILAAGALAVGLGAARISVGWSSTDEKQYQQALRANKPWEAYEHGKLLANSSPANKAFRTAVDNLPSKTCNLDSISPERVDAWSQCPRQIGEPSFFGRVIMHPREAVVFKVPNERHTFKRLMQREALENVQVFKHQYDLLKDMGIQTPDLAFFRKNLQRAKDELTKERSERIDPRVAKVFKDEVQSLAMANRLGIPSPKLLGYNSKTHAIKMELLKDYVSYDSVRGKDPKLDEAVTLQTISALFRMHSNNMGHGDLHTRNIMVNPATKKISIIDFGLAAFDKRDGNSITDEKIYKDAVVAVENTLILPSHVKASISNSPIRKSMDRLALDPKLTVPERSAILDTYYKTIQASYTLTALNRRR